MIRPSAARLAATHSVLALLALVCGVAVVPAFGGRLDVSHLGPRSLVLAVIVGAVVPAAVVAGGRTVRAAALVTATAALAVSVVAVLAVAGCGLSVVRGPERILTSALPATADPASCSSVGLLVALASLVSALVAAYGSKLVRALAVVPALVLLPVAFAVDAGTRLPGTAYAMVVVLMAAFSLALLRSPSDQPAPGRSRPAARTAWTIAGTLVVLAVAAAAVGESAAHLPGVRARAADAQDLVAPPLRARAAVAPMTQYPAFADGDDPVALHGTTSRRLGLLPMVTLSTFTGQTWTTASHFRRAGRTLSDAAPANGVPADGVSADPVSVTVDATDARELSWLVRPDRPVSVDRTGLGTDQASGDLVVPVGEPYPAQYTIVGSAPVLASTAEQDDAAASRTSAVSTDSQGVPAVIRRFAATAESVHTAYEQLITLEARLQSGAYRLATGASVPTGCGYAQLVTVLSGTAHLGTSEQYASLFALAARVLGYRSRVVLGFVPQYRRSGDRFTITGRDVHAWAQVDFAGAGWVAFDPTPKRSATTPVAPQANPAPNPAPAGQSPTTPPATHPPTRPTPQATPRVAGAGVSPWWFALLIIPVLLVLAPPVAKSSRRRRRRGRRVPAQAVLAAWDETTDRLIEAGAPARRGRSTGEVVAGAPRRVRHEVMALGALLDRAGYAPESADPRDADAAWSHARATRLGLRLGMPWWQRILVALDPRPLRRH